MVKTPPKKVFWGCFGVLNPFSGGTWTLRVCLEAIKPSSTDQTQAARQLLRPIERGANSSLTVGWEVF